MAVLDEKVYNRNHEGEAMNYPDLFKSYHPLKGSDWIRKISPEDRQAFVMIGFKESDFGRKGGQAVYQKYGKAYMAEIGRRGAIATNLKKRLQKEMES